MQLAQSKGGEHLAEQDHLAADAAFALHEQHLVAHVAQLEGGFHAPDAAADHQSVVLHAASVPAGRADGPNSASIAENSRM